MSLKVVDSTPGSVISSRINIFLWNSIFPSTDHDGDNGNVHFKSLNFVNSNMKYNDIEWKKIIMKCLQC